ncbi:MAG: 16S rRNA (adenine(1518)-N(6)/adenine(1519)-N(6))-dimethyltransferase RsmA [bacterium]|nr:16S rRNA (adenine(1518)-N(6)/adenine(1519)-N(6))-dimethyltransferase RsmA [bacterium]
MIKSAGQAPPTGQGLQGLSPQKRLGQNFLWQKSVLNKIVATATLSDQDLVLEIGPGLGSLTQILAKKANRVIAVEKDPRLIPILQSNLANFNNIEIIEGDILKCRFLNSKFQSPNSKQIQNPKTQILNKYKVVANLPYYAATHIIRQFLEAENPPELMVLMLQKEVAQRICPSTSSGRGSKSPRMNLLAVSVQFYADVKIIGYVSKKAFWPKPKVDGAIIKIKPLINADRKLINADLFFTIVKAGFSQPRKQLLNNLSKSLNLSREKVVVWLDKNKISPQQRPAEVALENWLALVKTFTTVLQ